MQLCYTPHHLKNVKFIDLPEASTFVLYWLDMGSSCETDNEVNGLLRTSETVSDRLVRSSMRHEEAARGLSNVCPGEVRLEANVLRQRRMWYEEGAIEPAGPNLMLQRPRVRLQIRRHEISPTDPCRLLCSHA